MRRILILLPILPLLFFACKKNENNNQFSYWYVNNDSFRSNNMYRNISHNDAAYGCSDNGNNFTVTFHFPSFPKSGRYPLGLTSPAIQDPDSIVLCFYYKNVFYVPVEGYVDVSSLENKTKCTLSPTKFVNYDNHYDTVRIHGSLNEP